VETPMLRTLIFALAIAAPGMAAAEDFPHAVVGSEVRGENGVVIGHVTAVQRDRHGNIIAVEIPGAEPPDASTVAPRMVAQNDQRALRVLVNDRRAHTDDRGSAERARLR
jgi:ribosomal 30S subunit maturation factor RimM